MFNSMIVVAVTPFSGTDTPDKRGELAMMLQCLAGRMPNRNVLSGVVAKRAGFEIGKTYLAHVRESGTDQIFGVDFTFIMVKELQTGEDITKTILQIGPPNIIYIERPEGYHYERKSNAVEGQKTERIKQGLYTPAVRKSSVNHSNAAGVRQGTSSIDDIISQNPDLAENFKNRDDSPVGK